MNWYNLLKIAQHFYDYQAGNPSPREREESQAALDYFAEDAERPAKDLINKITTQMERNILSVDKNTAEDMLKAIIKFIIYDGNIEKELEKKIERTISSSYIIIQKWKKKENNKDKTRWIQYKKAVYDKAVELIKKLNIKELIPQ